MDALNNFFTTYSDVIIVISAVFLFFVLFKFLFNIFKYLLRSLSSYGNKYRSRLK